MKRKLTVLLVALCLSLTAAVSVAASSRASADEPTYYTVSEPTGTVDFAASGLVADRATDTYSGTGESAHYGDNAIGATVDKTFTMSFFWDADDAGYGAIMVRTAGWADGPQVRLSKDGTIKVGYTKGGDTFVSIDNAEKAAFTKNEVYRLEYTPYTLYSDAELQTPVGLRLVAYVYNDDKTYEKTVTGDFTDLPADMGIDTGNLILYISENNEMHNHYLASVDFDPAAMPATYYTKPIAENKKFDLADTGLLTNPETDTYATSGQVSRAYAEALGTSLDSRFTMSFFFDTDVGERGSGCIAPKIAGGDSCLQVQIEPNGNVKVGDNCNGANFVSLPSAEVEAFLKNTVYDLTFDFVTLYADEACAEAAGLRATAHIVSRDGTYDKSVVKDYVPTPSATELHYADANWWLWISAELQGVHVASTQFDPTIDPPEPVTYYTKPASEIGTVDLADLGLFNDPVRDTFDSTGERAVYDKGTTVNKKLTMTFFWSGDAESWPSIMVRTAGAADDFQVRISKDGTIKVGHNRMGDGGYTVGENKAAFTNNEVYYLEYTIEHLYTDEACTEIGGVRQTAYIYNADKSYEKTVTRDTTPIPSNVNCTSNSFILFINAEMTNQHLGSFQYDPNAETVDYIPVTTLERAEKVDISKKMPMNAAGLGKEDMFTEEADGFYANRPGIYDVNTTLRFAFRGEGSFHFAVAGSWIWSSYKMDIDYGQNQVRLTGKTVSPTPTLSPTQTYFAELTVIEYKRSDNNEYAFEEYTCKLYYLDGNTEVVLVNETLRFNTPPAVNDDGSRNYFGIYMGKTGNDLHLYPVDFERDYAVTLINGDAENQQAFSYGEAYDISEYAPAKTAYAFTGWRYYEDGTAKLIPSTGVWTVDFTSLVGGVYTGTLTAVYTPIDTDVTYVVALGENSDENPATINVESGEITLAAPTPDTGYVFFGWYDNADFTGDRIETIEYTGEAIVLYAKIAEGVNITLVYPDGSEKTYGVEKSATFTFPTETVTGYSEITGWEVKEGDTWTAVSGNSITPAADAIYRAVAAAVQYSITYDLDGGANGENPANFTVNDAITFAPAVKEGYFFVGWFDGETQVRGIVKGTTGNRTVTARYVRDTLPTTLTVAAGSPAVQLPVPAGLPQGSRYTVTAADAEGTTLTVTANSCVFATAGTYKLTYTLTLPAATYTREVTVTAATPALTLRGAYESAYTVGTELTLLPSVCNIEGREVTVTVTKDGQAVAVTDGKLLLEAGTYTVTYATDGAEPLSITFIATAATEKKGCGCGSSALSGGLWAAGLLSLCALALLLLRRKRA